MRLLILVLNILVGSTMLVHSTEILAAADKAKANKNGQPRGHGSTLREKHKVQRPLPAKHSKSKNPGDVWERIRSGMKIPRPQPVQTITEQVLDKSNDPLQTSAIPRHDGIHADTMLSAKPGFNRLKPGLASVQSPRVLTLQKRKLITSSEPAYNYSNYTPYGRLKLNAAISSRVRKNIAIKNKLLALEDGSQQTDTSDRPRLRTRLDFHPRQRGIEFNSRSSESMLKDPPLSVKFFGKRLSDKSVPSVYPTVNLEQDLSHQIAKEAAKYNRVNKHINWFTQHRDYLHQVTQRARPYLYHVVDRLSKHNLPYELALLPIVESAYLPTAQSPKSAAGLWQFIPSTGHDFDLHQNEYYDARLDITASTEAALRYLSFLKQHYNGDWLLALAAYNCGLGLVDEAIKHNNAEGLETDYWSLRLPEETQEYVPRFLALSTIFANPAAHGLKLAPLKNEPYFVKVKIDKKQDIDYLADMDFKEIAELADLSYEQFNRLNPGYLNPKLASDGPFTFLMPAANANQFHQKLASIAQFLKKPESPATTFAYVPMTRRTLSTEDERDNAVSSMLSEIQLPKVTVNNPFLSLNLDPEQTTPRLVNQSVITPAKTDPDS